MKKKREQKRNYLRFIPLVLAAIVLAAGIAVFVSEPTILGFFNRQYSFSDAWSAVKSIENAHNVSFSDYDRGFDYVYRHPPKDPLNVNDVDPLVSEYDKISGDKSITLLVNSRKDFFEAYRYYLLSKKTYKADIHLYPLVCSNRQYIEESAENQKRAAEKLNSSVSYIIALQDSYPEYFSELGISEKWISLYSAIPEDLQAEINYKIDAYNALCGTKNGTITS